MGMEQKAKRIISGENNSLTAKIIRKGLGGLSKVYEGVVNKRNSYYDENEENIEIVYQAKVPVISIGNITAGGTGKTPFAAFICKYYLEKNKRPAILLRGYKAKDNTKSLVVSNGSKIFLTQEEAGDEAYLLAKSLPKVDVLIGRKRIESAAMATECLEANVLLVDDGFQHRKLKRDMDIVLIDSTNPFGYEKVIPAGLLREPLEGLNRADLIILTKTNQVERAKIKEIKEEIAKYAQNVEVLESIHKPANLKSLKDWQEGNDDNENSIKKVMAVSAIGNPASFTKTLEQGGYEVIDHLAYIDHHNYKVDDLKKIDEKAQELKVDAIAITEKDAVKIVNLIAETELKTPIYVLPITIEITSEDKKDIFTKMLNECIEKKEG